MSVSDDNGGLVTVLATDGYTCVTSPKVVDKKRQPEESRPKEQPETTRPVAVNGKVGSSHLIGVSGDSGLSSDSSDKSSSSCSPPNNRASPASSATISSAEDEDSNANKREEEDEDEIEGFSDSDSHSVSSADKEEQRRLQEEYDDIEAMYAERNVLQEEATTVQAERISIGGFKQRFCGSSGSSDLPAVTSTRGPRNETAAPPPPPRNNSAGRVSRAEEGSKVGGI